MPEKAKVEMASASIRSVLNWLCLPGKQLFLVTLTVWCCTTQASSAASIVDESQPPWTVPCDIVENTHDLSSLAPLATGGYFRCNIPQGWSRIGAIFGLSADEKKVYGVELRGPWVGEIPPRITVNYYAEGNLLYSSVDHYLRVFAQPALGVALEGSSYGAISPAIVSGREGMTFERIKSEYVPLNNTIGPVDREAGDDPRVYERREMMARPVPVRERFVVLPASSGFYAMRYSAAEEHFPEFLSAFEQIVATFHALK